MTEPDVDVIAHRQANLRYLLHQWDPLGMGFPAGGEYDCLLAPLWGLLVTGASRAAVSELLWYDLEDHLGGDPVWFGVDELADRLVAWPPAGRTDRPEVLLAETAGQAGAHHRATPLSAACPSGVPVGAASSTWWPARPPTHPALGYRRGHERVRERAPSARRGGVPEGRWAGR